MRGPARRSLVCLALLLFCVSLSTAQESGQASDAGNGAAAESPATTQEAAAPSPTTSAATQPVIVETSQEVVNTPDATTAAPVENTQQQQTTQAAQPQSTVTQAQTQVVTQQATQVVEAGTTRQTTVQQTIQDASVAQTTVVQGGVTVVSSVVQAGTAPAQSGMVTSVRPTSVDIQVATADGGSVLIVVEGLTTTVAPESASDVQASISSASLAGTLNNDSSSSDDGGSSNKVWIIPVAVIGGIIGLCALAYIGFRVFRNRFKGLDEDSDMIKWPELKTSTDDVLMPQGARHVAGAGVDFGSDDGEDHAKSPALSRNSSVMFGAAGSQQHGGSQGHQPYYDNRSSYYDPYLGQQQETIERRSSNLSYASRLPPGASSPNPTFRPLSPAGATTASVYDDYRSNTPHLPEDHGLLDRNGTLRSVGSGGQKLGIANPSVEGH